MSWPSVAGGSVRILGRAEGWGGGGGGGGSRCGAVPMGEVIGDRWRTDQGEDEGRTDQGEGLRQVGRPSLDDLRQEEGGDEGGAPPAEGERTAEGMTGGQADRLHQVGRRTR